MINVGYILRLTGDKKYIVSGKVIHKNITYYQLCNINNMDDILYCYMNDGLLVGVDNQELINLLKPLFYISLKETLNQNKAS